jgi:hypothetical protein
VKLLYRPVALLAGWQQTRLYPMGVADKISNNVEELKGKLKDASQD